MKDKVLKRHICHVNITCLALNTEFLVVNFVFRTQNFNSKFSTLLIYLQNPCGI